MSVLIALITAVPILLAMRKGLKDSKPNLLLICLGLLVWFVVAPLYTALPLSGIGNWSGSIIKAQFLGLLWSALIISVAWWYGWRHDRLHAWNQSIAFEQGLAPTAHPRVMLVASFILTALAYGASIVFAIVGGGRAWARVEANQFAGMGALGILSSNILLFPLVVWYLFLLRYRMSMLVMLIAAVQLLVVCYSFLYSGVTGGPLGFLLPFGVLWCMRGQRLSTMRFATICIAGYGAVWLLRFMRLLGQLTSGGQVNIDVSSALELYENSGLRPSSSFSEFFWFAKAVEHVDGGGIMMGAKAYLSTFLQFVPAYVWPNKLDFLADARVDAFMRDVVLKGLYGGLIPVGMYGEAYLSYGLGSFIVVAALLGWLTGFVDTRFKTSLWGIPGPIICAMFCTVMIVTCRGSSQYLLTSVAPIAMFALLCRLLRPMGRAAEHNYPAEVSVEHVAA